MTLLTPILYPSCVHTLPWPQPGVIVKLTPWIETWPHVSLWPMAYGWNWLCVSSEPKCWKFCLFLPSFLTTTMEKNICQPTSLFKENDRHKEHNCPIPIMRTESPQLLQPEVELFREPSPDQLNFNQCADVWVIVNDHRLKELRFGWFVMQQQLTSEVS